LIIKHYIIILLLIIIFQIKLFAQSFDDSIVPVSNIFNNIGSNALHSITYNYGLNFIGAGLGTFVFVETGIDWKWRNITYNNDMLSSSGRPGLYIGYMVPAITPIITYTTGRFLKNEKLQITGLALAQSVLLTCSIYIPIKMISGRTSPGIVTELNERVSARTNDFSGEFNWFDLDAFKGWPSGHTANVFAAATTISEIYSNKLPLKIAVFSYAALIGFGVTLNVHWASDVLAGALIGYAVGKTVGRRFTKLSADKQNNVSLYCTINSAVIVIRL
jgi:membrane-associated phospholipid phosphatase